MSQLSYNEQRKADMKKNILAAAKEYFVQHGISNGLQMKEVAAAAKTSRQTLYAYFKNIDEIAFAVAGECAAASLNYVKANYRPEASPIKNICTTARLILSFGADCPTDTIYLYLFDAYKHNNPITELNKSYEALYRSTNKITDLIVEGQRIGEIRKDVDEKLAQSLMANIFLALSMRICVVSNSREDLLCRGFDKFSDEVVDMLYRYLKT